jgi:phosphate transport system ATP-binding protein
VELLKPPPIRRIVIDEPLTVVSPPSAPKPDQNGHGQSEGQGETQGPASLAAFRARRKSQRRTRERMTLEHLTVAYSGKMAVSNVSLPIRQGEVLALIGPSGCGKTTMLRSLNRMTELTATATRSGRITLDGEEIHALEVTQLRRRVSMVFQQPNPFPMSVFDNVAYALREQALKRPRRTELRPAVLDALERAGLLDEVKDRLEDAALRLSGGQQQRLCIARALAAGPEVLLLDEPCSALDPRSTATIEDLIVRLRDDVAIVIVTHNLQQAYRVADRVAFMYLGELVEYGPTERIFGQPEVTRTREYVSGAFG